MTASAWAQPTVDDEDSEALWQAQLREEDTTASAFTGIDLAKLGRPIPPPDWLVTDCIARGWLTLIGAKPGVGKSWLGIDLAIALATARPWLGHDVPGPLRVLYLDAENGEDLALERMHQLGGRADTIDDRLVYVAESIDLPGRDISRLRVTVAQFRPDLVVVDTLASIAPTAERDTESSAAFLTAVWHLVRDAGAAMVLLVHLRKSMQGAGKDDALDAFRGAGHLVGAAHRAWKLDPVSTDKPVFLMHDVKARRGQKDRPLRIRVIDDEDADQLTTRVDVEGTLDAVEEGYDTFLANVLAYLDATPHGEGKTGDLILLPDAPKERTAKDYLGRALGSGVLHKVRRGVYTRASAPQPVLTETEGSA